MASSPPLPLFFIIGRPRTGTTLLQSLLDAHPNIQIPWECQFVLNLYPRYGKITNWSQELLLAFYDDLLKQWQFSTWNIDRYKLRADLINDAGKNTYRNICEKVYLNFISLYPKHDLRWIGDKNHGYTIYIDRLKRIYPEAKFIYVLRDYRDNFYSVTRVDFELPVVSLVTYKWKYFYRQALSASRRYPGDVLFLRYEDLAREPERYFGQVCTFLGIDYHASVFDFYKKKEEVAKTYPTDVLDKHHKSLYNPINTSRLNLWKQNLTPVQVKIADMIAGEYAVLAGYERQYVNFGMLIRLRAIPGVAYARLLYLLTHIIDRFPYRWREKILSKGPLWLAGIAAEWLNKKQQTRSA
ncbi:MAG: sulfotransferase [Lentimicrobiaceae bacterium]|nr:sulfotransferase [Lentimicrobiaceae bacterium]